MIQTISVLNYGMGNLGSVVNMLKRFSIQVQIVEDYASLKNAEKLILPGVGSFDKAMSNLDNLGFTELLKEKINEQKIPVLGICLGMQLLTKSSEEGSRLGLGLINANVRQFSNNISPELKVPHMGWNLIKPMRESKLLENLDDQSRFYFVHSYFVECHDVNDVIASTYYGIEFVSAFQQDNIVGVQFHPEKSHRFGATFLKNFVDFYYVKT